MKKETTYGLTPRRLARLLSLGLRKSRGRKGARQDQTPAVALRERLSRKLVLDPTVSDSLPAVLNRPCHELFPAADRTMSDLLTDSRTDPAVIRAIKDYAGELARRSGPEAKQAAAIVIYYAAIAAALVFHNQSITDHSYEKLHDAYGKLEQEPWIPSELKDLFRKAHALCEQHRRKNANGA